MSDQFALRTSVGVSTTSFIDAKSFEDRLRLAISAAWQIFSRKVGGGLIPVNKEASMQLQYAYLLKQVLPLTIQDAGETADLELETGVNVGGLRNNIDILVCASEKGRMIRIAIELKCYRDRTATGGKRGASDIFMKDVYEDLEALERYVDGGEAQRGVALVMVDLKHYVHPSKKEGKHWAYDISHQHRFPGGKIDVAIGGKPVLVVLGRSYQFHWESHGPFWFLEVEGEAL